MSFNQEISIILVLLVLNAFFALSEIALVSSSRPLLKQLAKKGSKRAQLALKLSENTGLFLSTVQVGMTLIGIMAGAFGGTSIADKLAEPLNQYAFINPHGETVAVAVVVGIITYLTVVVGELVPKQSALGRPEKIALLIAYPMWVISIVFRPVVKVLDISAAAMMSVMGLLHMGSKGVTEAEVRAVISEGRESGALEESEHEMLQRIIRFGDRDATSIMTHRMDVTFLDVNDSLEAMRGKIHRKGHARYPVIDGSVDKVIGVVQSKELLDPALAFQPFDLRDYMRPASVLPDTAKCLHVLEMFKSTTVHLVVVVDEYGSTQGVVTASDIMEAIVGVMPGNYGDGETAAITTREDGSWLVDGLIPIDELHLSIGLEEIEHSADYDTLAGFILKHLGKTPHEGDSFELAGYRFEILHMDGRRVDKVLIQPPLGGE